MNKIFLFILIFGILNFLMGQDNSSYIYLNASLDNQGVMYKSPDGTGTYVVLPKNTLYSISKLHGMSVEELQNLNFIFGTQILIGQKLKVKSSNPSTSQVSFGNSVSLDRSEVNNNLEKKHLRLNEAGNLEISSSHPAMIRAQKLKDGGENLEKMKGTHISKENELWYVPNDNDNFHTIATRYDMDFEALKTLNSMNDYLFRKGMVLVVVPGKLYGTKPMPENMPNLEDLSNNNLVQDGYSTFEIPIKKRTQKTESDTEIKTDFENEQLKEEKNEYQASDSAIDE